jgi:fatty-acyl-CoA synthase
MNAAGKILKYKMREEAAERLGLKGAGGIDTAGDSRNLSGNP